MLKTAVFAVATAATLFASSAYAARAKGIDVSAWQGSLTQANWNSVAASGIEFAFIRATRGGTTGTYNQTTRLGTLSRRYDDPYFVQNMNRAKNAGLLVGAYHFLRADVINGNVEKAATGTSSAVYFDYTNNALDEANHFLEVAGSFIKPGFLRPVLDIEAGNLRTAADLTNYALTFSNRIHAVTGLRPIVYVNGSYATSELTSAINSHDLWLARYILASSSSPTSADISNAAALAQTMTPPGFGSNPNSYGVWNSTGSNPWDFWQYTDAGRVAGISGNVDHNVANGDINFVRTFLVPEPASLAGFALVGVLLRRKRK